jgi:hypothetical protein
MQLTSILYLCYWVDLLQFNRVIAADTAILHCLLFDMGNKQSSVTHSLLLATMQKTLSLEYHGMTIVSFLEYNMRVELIIVLLRERLAGSNIIPAEVIPSL